jgi:hypothetical protein
MSKIEVDKKTLAAIMTITLAVSSIISGVMVYTGHWTPEQGEAFKTMVQQVMKDMNLTYQQVMDALQVEVGSTFYGLQNEYSYLVSHPLGDVAVTGMQNGTTGAFQWWGTNQTRIEENAVGNTTNSMVFLKDIPHHYNVSLPQGVSVRDRVNGSQRTYGNVLDSTGSPYTISVDTHVAGYYMAQDSSGKYINSSTNASTLITTAIASQTIPITISLQPGGYFPFTAPVLVNQKNVTILANGAELAMISSGNINAIFRVGVTGDASYFHLVNAYLEGNDAAGSTAVEIGKGVKSDGVTVEKCVILRFTNGVYNIDGTNGHIENNNFEFCYAAITVGNTTVHPSEEHITGNHITGNYSGAELC